MTAITVHSQRFLEEDIVDGDIVSDDWAEETVDIVPDEDATAIDLAVEFLSDRGLTEPSCAPIPAPEHCSGLWFSHVDGSFVSNHYTGERIAETAHLNGFSAEQIHAIARRVGARWTT